MKVRCLLALALCAHVAGWAQTVDSLRSERSYFLRDYSYYKPMLADIRSPQFHMRFYRDQHVPFSNSTMSGRHYFWDVGFGGFFSLLGFSFDRRPVAHVMERTGMDVFLDASAHMLLDFNTKSADVMNTDFRLGAGITARLPRRFKNISLLTKFFHESTHIGDEYSLAASRNPAFHRYNVSYEAFELFAAGDHYRATNKKGALEYFRLYAGARLLTRTAKFEDFGDAQESYAKALKTTNRWETQTGGELFWRGWLPASAPERRNEDWLAKWLKPQSFVTAVDFYRRDQYAVLQPEKRWCVNAVCGVIYGDYFRGQRTIQWLINYYDGVNPHGQFRADRISYWGLDIKVGF